MLWMSNDDVDNKLTNQLIERINEVNAANSQGLDEKLIWYFSTEGGDIASAREIIDIINTNKDIIELIASDVIASSGFFIFFKSMCKRRILPYTIGVHHSAVSTINIRVGNLPKNEYDVLTRSKNRQINSDLFNLGVSLGLDDIQCKTFKKGKDVIIEYPELQILLTRSIELNANILDT